MGKRGPQPSTIDWVEFEKLCRYQCTQREIADFFEVDVTTLEDIALRDKGQKLSVIWEQNKGSGRARLRKLQWTAAEEGNVSALIWLGKQYLNQRDNHDVIDITPKALIASSKKTFEEFCIDAMYPKPFPKQIEMKDFGMGEGEPRLLLGARGYGKSDYVTILGVAYDVYLNGSNTTNLIISKSKTRNTSMIQEIANALKANGVSLEKENASCVRVHGLIGKDHSVEVLTIKSSFRGRHPKRIIMDDPVTEEDTSEAMRTLVKKKYDEAYKLCRNILIIGQPAHAYDLYAELRPALTKLEVPHGDIPELDADLDAMRLAGVDERSIQMSYHLKVISQGETPFDNIRYLDRYPAGDSVAFIDPSFEGGDYTALTIMRAHFDGVAVVGFAYKRAWNHCLDDIVKKLGLYNARKICFETNSLGDQPLVMLRQLLGSHIGIIGKKSNTNKHSRIMSAGSYAHLIHLSKESDKVYTDQVVKYEYKAKHDDAPDSLASCLEWIGLIRGKQ
jgi:hypothetical protein